MILLVSPGGADGVTGNAVTARRWMAILRELGQNVVLSHEYQAGDYAALVALHARKSATAIQRFHTEQPHAPIVIALTGTDLYPDLRTAGVDPAILALANRLVVLQPLGLDQLDPAVRERARVIVQSVPPIRRMPAKDDVFEVVFIANVRPVKDPLLLAKATRRLPPASRIRVTHIGGVHDGALRPAMDAELVGNDRYDWLGPRPRPETLAALARARLLVLTSRHEGGANVISEALATRVPVLCSAIPGSVGLLGADYPGYFPVGDTDALARALFAVEQDPGRYRALQDRCAALSGLVEPARERMAWAALLDDLTIR
jgi:putative glycosyltransferase (TIGR04348 family)